MSEIRFACPHCAQHIACEESYRGASIDCPACQGRMIVPHNPAVRTARNPTAAVGEFSTAATARATGESDLDYWTEEAWRKHSREVAAAEFTGLRSPWVFYILLFTPAVLTLIVLAFRSALFDIWLTLFVLLIVLCVAMGTSAYCGRWLAERTGYGEFVAKFFSFVIFLVNGFVVMAGCVSVDRSG